MPSESVHAVFHMKHGGKTNARQKVYHPITSTSPTHIVKIWEKTIAKESNIIIPAPFSRGHQKEGTSIENNVRTPRSDTVGRSGRPPWIGPRTSPPSFRPTPACAAATGRGGTCRCRGRGGTGTCRCAMPGTEGAGRVRKP